MEKERQNKHLLAALKDFDRAIELKPDYGDAFSNRAKVRYRLGDFDMALVDYDHAIRLGVDNFNVHNGRGIVLAALGRHEDAIISYDRAIMIEEKWS